MEYKTIILRKIKQMKKLIILTSVIIFVISCKKENISDAIIAGSISSFICEGDSITAKLIYGQSASHVQLIIPYSGGNGKNYDALTFNSTEIDGLIAKLPAGTLQNGAGSLVFDVAGIPSNYGVGTFTIQFGSQTCKVSFTVERPTSGNGPVIVDVDGNSYKTVFIGSQHWMGENLKVSKYNDGTFIPNIKVDSLWQKDSLGAWCDYDNNPSNGIEYGKLYNWYVVNPKTIKNVCPSGWHVPTDAEWTILIDYLGGTNVAGGKMKEVGTAHWKTASTGTNSSLFTALGSGVRLSQGYFGVAPWMASWQSAGIGIRSYWWSVSEYSSDYAINRYIDESGNFIGKDLPGNTPNFSYKKSGLAIRCVK